MFKDIKVTLYDIFGYLIPGIVFLSAIVIFFWSSYFPKDPLEPFQKPIEIQLLFLLLAFLAGHLAQSLGNILGKFSLSTEELVLSMPYNIVYSAKSKVSSMLDVDIKYLSLESLFKICDEAVVQHGKSENREMYIYHEGFYRGLTISFLAFSLSLSFRTLFPGASIMILDTLQPISWTVLWFFILISLAGSLLAFFRYRRFAEYRVTRAILGFLTLEEVKISQDTSKED